MINELLKLGKIPNDSELSDELFKQYDYIIQSVKVATYAELEQLIKYFSDECDDLNWGLVHLIEYLTRKVYSAEQYNALISSCNNHEFKEILCIRLNNSLQN